MQQLDGRIRRNLTIFNYLIIWSMNAFIRIRLLHKTASSSTIYKLDNEIIFRNIIIC